jgi:hypothetical protein
MKRGKVMSSWDEPLSGDGGVLRYDDGVQACSSEVTLSADATRSIVAFAAMTGQ